MPYIHVEIIDDIEAVLTGKPIDAGRGLFMDAVIYLNQVEDWRKFLDVKHHINKERVAQAKEKLETLLFWQEVLEENVLLLRLETERSVLQLREMLKINRNKRGCTVKRFNTIPTRDLTHLTAPEIKDHEWLRNKIKKNQLWT